VQTPEFGAVANYAYHFDAGLFGQMLREHATTRLGVRQVVGLMAADRVLAEILRDAVAAGTIDAAMAASLQRESLRRLLPSAAEEAAEEGGIGCACRSLRAEGDTPASGTERNDVIGLGSHAGHLHAR
jgi:hypothetical protein